MTEERKLIGYTEREESELEKLQKLVEVYKGGYEAQRRILASIMPDKFSGMFICGQGGTVDVQGLPEMIMVCPTYGLDGFAVYKKSKEYSAPEY